MRHPLLFLGCSLQQDRTVQVLESLHKELDVIHYAVLEAPADLQVFTQRGRFLSDLGIRVVWFPTKRFELIEELLNYLADQAGGGSAGGVGALVTRILTPADAPYFASEVYRLLEKRFPPDDLKPCEDMTRWLATPDPGYFGYFIIAELRAHPVSLLYLHRRAGVPYAFVSYLVVRNEPGPERQSLDRISSSLLTEVMRQMKRSLSGLDELRGFLAELAHPATAPNAAERTKRVGRFRLFETLAAANGFQLHAIDVGYLQPPLSVEEDPGGIPHLLLLARRREAELPQQLSRAEAIQILKYLYLDLYPSGYSDDPCEIAFIRETCGRMLAVVTANLPDEVKLLGYRHFAPRLVQPPSKEALAH